jgi:hypothetical protein
MGSWRFQIRRSLKFWSPPQVHTYNSRQRRQPSACQTVDWWSLMKSTMLSKDTPIARWLESCKGCIPLIVRECWASLRLSLTPSVLVRMFREHVSRACFEFNASLFEYCYGWSFVLVTNNVCGCLQYSPQLGRVSCASSQVQGLHGHLALQFFLSCTRSSDHDQVGRLAARVAAASAQCSPSKSVTIEKIKIKKHKG